MTKNEKVVIDEEYLKNVNEVKKPQIPFYLTSESKLQETGNVYNIFDLNLEEVVYEKMFILFEKYQVIQKKLDDAKVELQIKKEEMLMSVDFKKELDSNRPTIAEKDAYMRPFLAEYEEKVDKLNYDLKYYSDKLKVLNDLISTKRLMLEIEASLKN